MNTGIDHDSPRTWVILGDRALSLTGLDGWAGQIAGGVHRGRRREVRIPFTVGAGPDRPVHPHLPEAADLKVQLLQLR